MPADGRLTLTELALNSLNNYKQNVLHSLLKEKSPQKQLSAEKYLLVTCTLWNGEQISDVHSFENFLFLMFGATRLLTTTFLDYYVRRHAWYGGD